MTGATATQLVVVPLVGDVVPPLLVEVPSAKTTSAGASGAPEVIPTTPTVGTLASATPTGGGIRAEDSPQNGVNSKNNGDNNNVRILLKENVQNASSKTGQENTQVAGQANSLQ